MGGEDMRRSLAILWQKIANWLAVLGSAHVVDDGTDIKEKPSKKRDSKLRLVPHRG
jgi:hypothetical protein